MNDCLKGHHIPENALTCPTCARERGEAAFRDLQVEFLRKAASGEFSYALRVAKGVDRHVLMYSSYTRAFCGQELTGKPQIQYAPYNADTLVGICAACRTEIARVLEEATA